MFETEADGQRRGGRNSAVEKSSDGWLRRYWRRRWRSVRSSSSADQNGDGQPVTYLRSIGWFSVARCCAAEREAMGQRRQIASKVLRPERGALGDEMSKSTPRSPIMSPTALQRVPAVARGADRRTNANAGPHQAADCHRLPSLRMVDQYRVSMSRASCAGLLWLRCGWTTYACGRPPHRGSD